VEKKESGETVQDRRGNSVTVKKKPTASSPRGGKKGFKGEQASINPPQQPKPSQPSDKKASQQRKKGGSHQHEIKRGRPAGDQYSTCTRRC